eukprot:16604-Heterococcus_DN1.PRE.4
MTSDTRCCGSTPAVCKARLQGRAGTFLQQQFEWCTFVLRHYSSRSTAAPIVVLRFFAVERSSSLIMGGRI